MDSLMLGSTRAVAPGAAAIDSAGPAVRAPARGSGVCTSGIVRGVAGASADAVMRSAAGVPGAAAGSVGPLLNSFAISGGRTSIGGVAADGGVIEGRFTAGDGTDG